MAEEQRVPGNTLHRAADSIWDRGTRGRSSGDTLRTAFRGVRDTDQLTLEEVRAKVSTVYAGLPRSEEREPDSVVDEIMQELQEELDLIQKEDPSKKPLEGITLPQDWELPANWKKVEVADYSTKDRQRDEIGTLETLLHVTVEVLEQNEAVVTRYVIKSKGSQTKTEREYLSARLKEMSPPSPLRAIVSLE